MASLKAMTAKFTALVYVDLLINNLTKQLNEGFVVSVIDNWRGIFENFSNIRHYFIFNSS